MIKRLIWTIWTMMSSVLKKADKLNLSLSFFVDWNCWKVTWCIRRILVPSHHQRCQPLLILLNHYSFWCCKSPYLHIEAETNGGHFPDGIFKCIFLNENVLISIKISLKFVPKGPINNIPVLVQIMAWRRPGDKPLSEPRMVSLPTHICVTRPQWVNISNGNQEN